MNITDQLTGEQIWKARESLEQGAAILLGKMLFEFSRLDVNLGLCVVWTDGGKRIPELTKQIAEYTFHKKLDFLSNFVEQALPRDSKRLVAYTEWIGHAHAARLQRNQLVHGRWGVDPIQQEVINVIGLPTSSEQIEYRYTLSDLENVLQELKELQTKLHKLREQWPI